MYENHRDNFGRRRHHDERGAREDNWRENDWRQGEDRYRRESAGQDRFDRDRYGSQGRNREYGYGGTSREQDEYGWFGGEPDGYAARGASGRENRAGRGYQRQQAPQRSGTDYYGSADQGHPGDSSYFTGTQGSWAMPSPARTSGYGAGGFGADYREHGYGSRSDGDHRGFLDRAGDEIASWFGDEDAARRREQDHRGRGPKNYVRSDERIRDDANDRLTEDWRIDAQDITVTVENGEVTLDGTVTDRAAKRRAEDLIEDISGVKHVQNNLRVAQANLGREDRGTSDAGGMTSEGGTLSASRTDQTV
jgi:osmotically-inducible protein OsmY